MTRKSDRGTCRPNRRVRLQLMAFMIAAMLPTLAFGQGDAIEHVVPRFLANTEGNIENLEAYSFPNGWRIQAIYAASEFEDLPESHRLITEMRWRPDASVATPITSTEPFEIRVSTTQQTPSTMSRTYAENVERPETLVLAREITRSTANVGPAEGPREFDLVFPFDTPFYYDPAAGNLLVDIINLGPVEGTDFALAPDLHDGTSGLASWVGDPDGYTNPVAPSANLGQIPPTMFVFVPEPTSFILLTMGLAGIALHNRERSRLLI